MSFETSVASPVTSTRNIESYKEKLLNSHANTPNSSLLKEEFLLLAHTYFPAYFSESFFAKLEDGRCTSTEVQVTVSPPEEDRPVLICLTRQSFDKGLEADSQENETQISIADICSIALKEDGTSLELNRKNGIPLTLTGLTEIKSLLSLLCGYYRQLIMHLDGRF